MTTSNRSRLTSSSTFPRCDGSLAFHFTRLDPDKREEAIQNTLAIAWKFLHALFERGRLLHPEIWKSVLWYSVRQTKRGRTPVGQPGAKDAFECRRNGRVKFEPVDLHDLIGRKTPVLDQVIFRSRRGPLSLHTHTPPTDARLRVGDGGATKDVAERHGVTPGAISQFRSRFKTLYDDFFAE